MKMKEAVDTSPSRRQVLRLAAMVTACAVAAKAPNAAEPLKGETDNSYVPADGVSTFESVWETVRGRFYDPRHNGLDWPTVRERYLPRRSAGNLPRLSGARHQHHAV
ncbi:hypothetical protein [Bradyrhizobium tropiciagri]|uniref:hypothetical protein n=1 Tax=Bradyrhizobium tropiciagri TaxID=312253 RepID=UPI001009B0C4